MVRMDEQLSILLERAARYRNAARTVDHDQTKHVLLALAAGYVSLARLLIDDPNAIGGKLASDALMAVMPQRSECAPLPREPH